ncbi:MAG: GTP cyclohydrolase I FolE [Planctomycetota bacterium]|nr:GTP cyclohydrolase I FolE [Planctomycetota bacterium]RLS47917.1 MAG: GTP cyclohydrolase I FolE [Planctomycetota bacterium]HAQ67136.1 GTP cyclohydrolase I FolE [Phycisphaerales bacterium]
MPEPRPTPEQVMVHVREILRFIGEDPQREGLLDTPARVVKAMGEHFAGYGADPIEPLSRTFGEIEGYDELVLLSNIQLHSHCEHHMVPFVGVAHVGYIPNGRVVGLSKLARVVDIFSKRLQVQEKLTAQIAGVINDTLQPTAVGVVIQARHFCMCYRGVQQPGAITTTSKLHGTFLSNAAARSEFFQLITSAKRSEGL